MTHGTALFPVAHSEIAAVNHMQVFMVLTFIASFLAMSAGSAATHEERWGRSIKGDTEEAIVWSGHDSYIAVSCGIRQRRYIVDSEQSIDDDSFHTSMM